jgi:hypothetical protein
MKQKQLKMFFAMLIFLVLDCARPFNYSLNSEFTFLGIIFLSLNFPFYFSLLLSMLFGYFKDCIGMYVFSFNLIEFSLLSVFISYFLHNFNKKIVKFMVIFSALILHVSINGLYINNTALIFSVRFVIQSAALFLLLNKLLSDWINPVQA